MEGAVAGIYVGIILLLVGIFFIFTPAFQWGMWLALFATSVIVWGVKSYNRLKPAKPPNPRKMAKYYAMVQEIYDIAEEMGGSGAAPTQIDMMPTSQTNLRLDSRLPCKNCQGTGQCILCGGSSHVGVAVCALCCGTGLCHICNGSGRDTMRSTYGTYTVRR